MVHPRQKMDFILLFVGTISETGNILISKQEKGNSMLNIRKITLNALNNAIFILFEIMQNSYFGR